MKLCKLLSLILSFALIGCGQGPRQESRAERPRDEAKDEQARGPRSIRYDLARDEERGGHTLRKHVGRSDQELRERLQREPDISAASTWTDRAAAEETVGAALREEHGKIERWTQRGERRANLALHFDAGREIGRSLARGAAQAVPCKQAVIVLRADGDGFYVLTTYPEERE